MRRVILGVLAVLFALSQAVTFSQSSMSPTSAIDITNAGIQAVLKNAPPAVDQQLKIVDLGKLNLAVGVIHRGPTKDTGAISGISHDNTTETYIITSGSGTLTTGGTIENPRRAAADSEAVKVLNGPSTGGTNKGGYSRKVVPGDIIIIPAGVFHGWSGITDHVTYLSVRPDPDKVLPAGYVHPTLKAAGSGGG